MQRIGGTSNIIITNVRNGTWTDRRLISFGEQKRKLANNFWHSNYVFEFIRVRILFTAAVYSCYIDWKLWCDIVGLSTLELKSFGHTCAWRLVWNYLRRIYLLSVIDIVHVINVLSFIIDVRTCPFSFAFIGLIGSGCVDLSPLSFLSRLWCLLATLPSDFD